MRTELQKQAARANGARSRGPITPEGKLASSRNATTHGILSGTIVLEGESGERFHALLGNLLEELQPQTTVEVTLVENMAVARWRQMRIWGIEKANMEHEMRSLADARAASEGEGPEDTATRCARAFRTLSDDSRSLELINRYESRYDRQYLRAHRRFLELVDRRTPPPVPTPAPPPEGVRHAPDTVLSKRTRRPAPAGAASRVARVPRLAAAACAIFLSVVMFSRANQGRPANESFPDSAPASLIGGGHERRPAPPIPRGSPRFTPMPASPGQGWLLGNLVRESSAKLVIPNEDILPRGSVRRAPRRATCLQHLRAFRKNLRTRRLAAHPGDGATAETRDVPVEVRQIGSVEAVSVIAVKAQIGGELTKVLFREGDDVRTGQQLFEIDPRPYQQAIDQAQAAIEKDDALIAQAQANLARDNVQTANAKEQAERYAALAREGLISKDQNSTYQTTFNSQNEALRADEAAINSAKASLNVDKAALETARLNLSYCFISSPIDGRAGSLLVQAGNLVKANDTTALVNINQVSPIDVTFSVPEQLLSEIRTRNRNIRWPSLPSFPPEHRSPANSPSSTIRSTTPPAPSNSRPLFPMPIARSGPASS